MAMQKTAIPDTLIEAYNSKYKTSYTTEYEFLSGEYRKMSIAALAETAGYSPYYIHNRLKSYGIKRRPQGLSLDRKTIMQAFLKIPVERIKRMTLKEISEKTGASYGYASMLTKLTNRPCLNLWKKTGHGGE